MAQGPHLWIAGLLTTGGIGFFYPSIIFASENNFQLNRLNLLSTNLPVLKKTDKSSLRKSISSHNQKTPRPPLVLQLKADRQVYNSKEKLFVAEGNVSAVLNGSVLKADRIEFDRAFTTLYATGRVRFRKGSQYFQASSFLYSLTKKEGYLEDVYGVVDLEYLDNDLRLLSSRSTPKLLSSSVKESSNKATDSYSEKSKDGSLVEVNQGSQDDLNRTSVRFPFVSSPNVSSVVEESIACAPVLPSIPDWHPFPWSLTMWGGQMTDSEFNEAFFFQGTSRPEYLMGIGINKRIFHSGPISFELEGDIFNHISDKDTGGKYQSVPFANTQPQNFSEGVLGIVTRLWLRPWLNIAFVEGLSYTTSVSNYERTKREKSAKLLNYLGFEVEALLTRKFSLLGRIHHRSGAFGTFSGAKEGSNAYLIGFKYRWGSSQIKKSESVDLLPTDNCLEGSVEQELLPQGIDDNLKIFSIENSDPLPSKKSFPLKNKNNYQTKFSKLSLSAQEALREEYISNIDQRVDNFQLKQNNFKIYGQIGIPKSSNSSTDNKGIGFSVSKLDKIRRAKLITGKITSWRIQAKKITINANGWLSDKVSFTNDPFTPSQTRIDARNVVAMEEENGDLLIRTSKSRLILEERMMIPIMRSTRIKRSQSVENRWVFGIDVKDRDGLFIGRQMRPFKISNDYSLTLQPQFLIQRSLKGKTDSYVSNNSSILTGKVTSETNISDLFALKAKIRGNSYGWDVRLDSNISTLNPERLNHGSRFWGDLRKQSESDFIGKVDYSFFGAYRYKAWNGSLGEREIYTAYGAFAEKNGEWQNGRSTSKYQFGLGLGEYQAEAEEGGAMLDQYRANIYGSLTNDYVIWNSSDSDISPYLKYRYTPVEIIPGLTFNTNLSSTISTYENGNTQTTLKLIAGPTLTLGKLSKPFLDYTKLSLSAGATWKEGSSPFGFDKAVDLATFGIALKQQVAGPLMLNMGFDFNIDKDSEYYGKTISSNIELIWSRRSYDFALFYRPDTSVGGLSFRLRDFKIDGTGIPFVPYKIN